jgi:nitrogen regulatory protein PII
MKTTLKKRLEIIIEAPVIERLETLLRREGVKGWTVIPARSGQGAHGSWSREGQVGEAGRMLMLLAIVDPADLDRVLEKVYALLERQIGVVAISDAHVVRADRF